jgi:hypothetical protein
MPQIKISSTEKVTVLPVTKIYNNKPLHAYIFCVRISILASQLQPFKINNLIERKSEDNTKECRLYYLNFPVKRRLIYADFSLH